MSSHSTAQLTERGGRRGGDMEGKAGRKLDGIVGRQGRRKEQMMKM